MQWVVFYSYWVAIESLLSHYWVTIESLLIACLPNTKIVTHKTYFLISLIFAESKKYKKITPSDEKKYNKSGW